MSWKVVMSPVATKRIDKIPMPEKGRILKAIDMLHEGLTGDIKRMKGSKDFRLRVGGWRIILSIYYDSSIIEVRYVDTRGDIYKH